MTLPVVVPLFSVEWLPAKVQPAYDDRMNDPTTRAFQLIVTFFLTIITIVSFAHFLDHCSNLSDIHQMQKLYEKRKQFDPVSQSISYQMVDDEMIRLVIKNQNCAYLYDMNATLKRR